MRVKILPSALNDLADGCHFYEGKEIGLGDYFISSLISDIDSLQRIGGVHAMKHNLHRMVASTFPFAIYYGIDRDVVVVRRVLDCRRDPKWIRKQLR